MSNIVSGVGLTALAAAAGRAVESTRPDRLIDDPFAAAFVVAADSPIPLPVRWPDEQTVPPDQELLLLYGSVYIGVRSRFFDEFVDQARADGIEQVVVLAAGLDTRAFRLDSLAGARLFELDQPAVLEFKDAVLRDAGATPRGAHTAVAGDLRDDWAAALRASGFDAGVPTAWLAEGLLQYLPPDAEHALFERIDELSAPGSRLAVERTANLDRLAAGGRLAEVAERTGLPMDTLMTSGARPDPADWLTGQGWAVTDEQVPTVAARYHRDLTDPGLPRPRADLAPATAPGPAVPTTSFVCARISLRP
jgi:methyltransferase (TIGR00027 family)